MATHRRTNLLHTLLTPFYMSTRSMPSKTWKALGRVSEEPLWRDPRTRVVLANGAFQNWPSKDDLYYIRSEELLAREASEEAARRAKAAEKMARELAKEARVAQAAEQKEKAWAPEPKFWFRPIGAGESWADQ